MEKIKFWTSIIVTIAIMAIVAIVTIKQGWTGLAGAVITTFSGFIGLGFFTILGWFN